MVSVISMLIADCYCKYTQTFIHYMLLRIKVADAV